jgi:hypothetical protein
VRIHLAREHALELELLDVLLDGGEVALHIAHGRFVVLLDREVQQLAGIAEAVADCVQRGDDGIELGALAPQLLRPVGRVPDPRIFQLAADFRQALVLVVVVKETSGGLRCARKGRREYGGSD